MTKALFHFIVVALTFTAPAAFAQNAVEAELVGNPFKERWPDAPYARNIWTMAVHDGRLYFGGGNSANTGPSQNAGPVPIISYDKDGFREDFTVEEEQITVFYARDGALYVPGHDTTESWAFGNLYRLDEYGWAKLRTVQHGLHVYDMHAYEGRLIAAGGAYNQPLDGWISDNDGASWRSAALLDNPAFATKDNPSGAFTRRFGGGYYGRLYTLFEMGGRLYASADAPLEPKGARIDPMRATLFVYDDDEGGFAPAAFHPATVPADHRDAFAAAGVDLFPGAAPGAEDGRLQMPVVQRDIRLNGETIYIGAWMHNDHQHRPFGLFAASSPEDARRIALPEGFQPYDLLIHDGGAYALVNRRIAENRFEIGVMTTDAAASGAWRMAARFEAPSFARAFAVYDGDVYFGLGTEIDDPHAEGPNSEAAWAGDLSAAAGDVLRVRGADVFAPARR